MDKFHQAFIKSSLERFNENLPRIEKCVALIDEAQFWYKPNTNSNSIANLMLHLCGNITQYIIAGIGEAPDNRQRDSEFSISEGYTKNDLLIKLKSITETSSQLINQTSHEDLLKTISVQGFELTGMGIIIHVVEHFSYHTGQIALLTKLISNNDLGFYAGIDLNLKQ